MVMAMIFDKSADTKNVTLTYALASACVNAIFDSFLVPYKKIHSSCFTMMIAAAFSFVARMSATSAFWLFLSLLVTTSITKSTAFVTPKNVVVRNVALHASWSDSKAVMDYQNFLASGQQNIQLARDGAAVIVKPLSGDTLLADCLFESGMGNDVVITPDQPLPAMETDDFPIYITLPPTQLEALLDNCPPSLEAKYDNFVFFSGGRTYGNIEDVLKQRGKETSRINQVSHMCACVKLLKQSLGSS
jgi:hypothetical protein